MKIFPKMAVLALSFAVVGVFAQEGETVLGEYGAITIKKVITVEQINGKNTDVETIVAFIDDNSDVEPVIPTDVVVDSVYYSRVFKQGVASTVMLPFEDTMLCAPKGYDAILRHQYGDYMQIPEDKATHDVYHFDPDVPYTEYFGRK